MFGWKRLLWVAALIVLAVCVLISCTGPVWPARGHMSAHDEPNVMTVTAAWVHGQPMYPAQGSPEAYALLYGPMAFVLQAPPVAMGVRHTTTLELWTIVPLVLMAICFTLLARQGRSRFAFVSCMVLYLMGDFMVSQYEWAFKGNAWMTFLGAAGLLAASRLRPAAAMFAVAIAGAALIDIRITSVFVALLPVCVLLRRFGGAIAVRCAGFMVVFTLLPFLLPGVSLRGYVAVLALSAHHGLVLANALRNLLLQGLLVLPALLLLGMLLRTDAAETLRALRRSLPLIVVGVIAALVAVVTGSKIGAGQHHSLPLIGAAAYVTALLWRRVSRVGITLPQQVLPAAVAVLQLCVGLAFVGKHLRSFRSGDGDAVPATHVVEADVDAVIAAHPGARIEMGYGEAAHYEYTWSRADLVLAGSPLLVDANSVGEDQLGGTELSEATTRNVLACPADIVLIPKGDAPYAMANTYATSARLPATLFPAAYRHAFLDRYAKSDTSGYFDLYTRRPACPEHGAK